MFDFQPRFAAGAIVKVTSAVSKNKGKTGVIEKYCAGMYDNICKVRFEDGSGFANLFDTGLELCRERMEKPMRFGELYHISSTGATFAGFSAKLFSETYIREEIQAAGIKNLRPKQAELVLDMLFEQLKAAGFEMDKHPPMANCAFSFKAPDGERLLHAKKILLQKDFDAFKRQLQTLNLAAFAEPTFPLGFKDLTASSDRDAVWFKNDDDKPTDIVSLTDCFRQLKPGVTYYVATKVINMIRPEAGS